jgi:hypothetical protein
LKYARAGIGILIATINQIYTSREANRQRQIEIETRQAELFTNIYNRWNTREMLTAYGLARFIISPPVKCAHHPVWPGLMQFIHRGVDALARVSLTQCGLASYGTMNEDIQLRAS